MSIHVCVCVPCGVSYRPERNGQDALEIVAGQPYRLWESDKWKCPSCGHEILTGFGRTPVSEHFERDFEERVSRREELIRFQYEYEAPKESISGD